LPVGALHLSTGQRTRIRGILYRAATVISTDSSLEQRQIFRAIVSQIAALVIERETRWPLSTIAILSAGVDPVKSKRYALLQLGAAYIDDGRKIIGGTVRTIGRLAPRKSHHQN
jgi:hypothetical protein